MMGSLMMAKAVQRRTRVRHSDFDRKRRASRIRHRKTYMLISGLIGAALGTAADLSISVLRTLTQPSSSGEFIWLFVWILGVTGVGLGATLGVKVADVYVGMADLDDTWLTQVSSELPFSSLVQSNDLSALVVAHESAARHHGADQNLDDGCFALPQWSRSRCAVHVQASQYQSRHVG